MPYDLVPKNKQMSEFQASAFFWTWLMEAGVGLVLGQGSGIEPGTYKYTPDESGRSPCSNDGFCVNSNQAKTMSEVAKGLVSVERGKMEDWKQMSQKNRQRIENQSVWNRIYSLPVREDFVDKAVEFADWSENSDGFKIY